MVTRSGDPSQRDSRLGPQARGLFDRLFGFGGRAGTPQTPRSEALAIAIAGGKGGTGKSFLAVNLAVYLHRRDLRVTLVDCDFGLGCDHLLLGLSPQQTLHHLVTGRASLAEVRQGTPAGPALLPGSQGIHHMTNLNDRELQRFGKALAELAALEDVIVLDVGAGIAPQNIMSILCADHVLLVTEPEIAAVTDAYALIKCAAQIRPNSQFSVLVNRVTTPGQGAKTFEKLADVSQRFTSCALQYVGEIGFDPMVPQRQLGRMPITLSDPESVTSRSLRAAFERLTSHLGVIGPRPVAEGKGIETRFCEHRLFLSS